ncbi:MAG TPA: hypothetical protein VLA19_17745 [Herpetosiphonaceae bacterium]|nr:hypothetical protein [Herpetosiphonaceae bacterium]
MAHLPTYFTDFLANIRLTSNQMDDLKRGHKTLRERLLNDDALARIIVNTFLQGSYRRATATRPKDGKRSDVDVIVVTKLSQTDYPDPGDAMDLFIPFLDKHYTGKYEPQGRSFGIQLSYVALDLVITSAPSESEEGIFHADSVAADDTLEEAVDWRLVKSWVALEKRANPSAQWKMREAAKEPEWKASPLYIPDREVQVWKPTHPLEQIRWTHDKNSRCSGHYVNVVKAIKWQRRAKHPTPKHPKGYPLEHIIGQNCPDSITSVAEGVTCTLEAIVNSYAIDALLKRTPVLPDHGVPTHNVLHRLSGDDFAAFYAQVKDVAKLARRAYDEEDVCESARLWRDFFGDKFPPPPDNSGSKGGPTPGGFTARENKSSPMGGRFG